MRKVLLLFYPIAVLGVLIFIVFWPCLSAGFLNWDDPGHLLRNRFLPFHGLSDIGALFLSQDSANATFIPLSIFSFGLERYVWGLNPYIFHFHNILIHVCAAFLLRALAIRMGLSEKGAMVAALIFALHPMRVESVAWITERKDVLFGAFYLGALVLYWDYVKSGRGRLYIAALVCAVASILSKPMALSLPLVLFLMDWMARRRWTPGAALDKLPFMATLWPIAAITAAMNVRVIPWKPVEAFLVGTYTSTFYVIKFFFPCDLANIYPVSRPVHWARPDYFLPIIALGILLGIVWYFRRERWAIFAFVFYVLSSFFIWRVDLFEGAKGIVSDRFMYIPCIGFALLLGYWSDRYLFNGRTFKRTGWIAVTIVCASLAWITFSRCFVWQDSLMYWNDVLRKDPDNTFALINRSACLLNDQAILRRYDFPDNVRYPIAFKDLSKAVRRAPKDADAWRLLADARWHLGDKEGAQEAFCKAAALNRTVF